MREQDFLLSTWRSLYNRIEGFFEHEQEAQRLEWERCRLISFYSYRANPYVKKPKRAIDLFKIPSEFQEIKPITKQEKEEIKAKFNKWDRKIEQDIKQLENADNG